MLVLFEGELPPLRYRAVVFCGDRNSLLVFSWIEEYKNFIFDSIMKILLCIRSHFHHEKAQEGKIFSLWSAEGSWKHLPKHQIQVIMKF